MNLKFPHYLVISVAFSLLGFASFAVTHAFFSSTATSTNNIFTAADQFPAHGLQSGDIIINELAWAGSSKGTSDEWIELRNTTGHSIDISNWQITDWTTSGSDHEELMLTIPAGKSIAAGGLFLIANKTPTDSSGTSLTVLAEYVTTSVFLSNSNLQVKLYNGNWDSTGLLLDTAGNKNAPLAGDHQTGQNKTFFSMERNSTIVDGTLASSWHTATTNVNLDSDSGQNKGTPDATND